MNQYIGYSEVELTSKESYITEQIRYTEEEINSIGQKLKQEKKQKKALEKQLELIKEARNYCNKVDFELVIRVYVSTKSKFVGKNPNITYYCRADYKDYQVYTFKIVKCNALDNTKSQEIVYSSTEYTWEERKEMTERILDLIKVNNIKKCYIDKGAKVAKAAIEKLGCKVIEK